MARPGRSRARTRRSDRPAVQGSARGSVGLRPASASSPAVGPFSRGSVGARAGVCVPRATLPRLLARGGIGDRLHPPSRLRTRRGRARRARAVPALELVRHGRESRGSCLHRSEKLQRWCGQRLMRLCKRRQRRRARPVRPLLVARVADHLSRRAGRGRHRHVEPEHRCSLASPRPPLRDITRCRAGERRAGERRAGERLVGEHSPLGGVCAQAPARRSTRAARASSAAALASTFS